MDRMRPRPNTTVPGARSGGAPNSQIVVLFEVPLGRHRQSAECDEPRCRTGASASPVRSPTARSKPRASATIRLAVLRTELDANDAARASVIEPDQDTPTSAARRAAKAKSSACLSRRQRSFARVRPGKRKNSRKNGEAADCRKRRTRSSKVDQEVYDQRPIAVNLLISER